MKTKYFKQNELFLPQYDEIISFLKKDQVIAFPTETVYGLGADYLSKKGQDALYELKNRPLEKGFIVHLGKMDDVELVAENIPLIFYKLAAHFFPGPLTLILKKKASLKGLISKDDTVAVRMPDHPLTLQLLRKLRGPIVGSSANLSGEKSAISYEMVCKRFDQKISCIVDGGVCSIKRASTILSLIDQPTIYREGAILASDIESVIKQDIMILN